MTARWCDDLQWVLKLKMQIEKHLLSPATLSAVLGITEPVIRVNLVSVFIMGPIAGVAGGWLANPTSLVQDLV